MKMAVKITVYSVAHQGFSDRQAPTLGWSSCSGSNAAFLARVGVSLPHVVSFALYFRQELLFL